MGICFDTTICISDNYLNYRNIICKPKRKKHKKNK